MENFNSVNVVTVNESPKIYYFVYKTTNLVNNLIYVGQHHQLENFEFDGYLGSGILIRRAIKRYKKENFKREFIEFCNTLSDMGRKETYWIAALSATDRSIGYNLLKGGEGAGIVAEETKLKISIAKIGKPSAFLGKHHSKESKNKMSESHKGKLLSEEHKIKIRNASKGNKSRTGQHASKEESIKRSISMKKYWREKKILSL